MIRWSHLPGEKPAKRPPHGQREQPLAKHDTAQQLLDHLQSCQEYVVGATDCVFFAGNWIMKRTGLDLFASYRDYTTLIEAAAKHPEYHNADLYLKILHAQFSRHFDAWSLSDVDSIRKVRLGDLVIHRDPEATPEISLGILTGQGAAYALPHHGPGYFHHAITDPRCLGGYLIR